jgi:hypothetical protein
MAFENGPSAVIVLEVAVSACSEVVVLDGWFGGTDLLVCLWRKKKNWCEIPCQGVKKGYKILGVSVAAL